MSAEVGDAHVSPPAQRFAREPRARAVAAVDDDGLGFRRAQAVRSSEHARERDVHRTRHVPPGELARRSHVEDSRGIAAGDPVQQRRRRNRLLSHERDCTCRFGHPIAEGLSPSAGARRSGDAGNLNGRPGIVPVNGFPSHRTAEAPPDAPPQGHPFDISSSTRISREGRGL